MNISRSVKRTACCVRSYLSLSIVRSSSCRTATQLKFALNPARIRRIFPLSVAVNRELSRDSGSTGGIVSFLKDDNKETSGETSDPKGVEEEDGDGSTGKYYIGKSETLNNFMTELLENKQISFSHTDWENLESSALTENSRLANSMEVLCMKVMLATKALDLAMNYLDYLREKGRSPKLSTLSLFIDLCGQVGGKEKQEYVYSALHEIEKQTDVFDWITAKHLIRGISCTDQWRRSLEFLDMAALTHQPGTAFYGPILLAALREGDIPLALSLLEKLGLAGLRPQDAVLDSLILACQDQAGSLDIASVMALWNRFLWFPTVSTARKIEEHFMRFERETWTCRWTTVNKRGICNACQHPMAQLELSDLEFTHLQQEFLERTLVGKNVYLKSTPEEVEQFQDFVSKQAPFDIIIDALNIAYKQQGRFMAVKSPQLRKVVNYFTKYLRKRVLVIGRKHMKMWPWRDMDAIERTAATYYTDNLSADDPFGLYATIYSGRQAMYVSDDYLRDHKHQLTPQVRVIFEKWQRTRQITDVHIMQHRVTVKMPSRHDTGPQQDCGGWHIPYDDGSEGPSYLHPNTWLCLRQAHHR